MKKTATTDAPLLPSIAERWSPRAFADRSVAAEHVRTILEAARWAPSSGNGQPWRYVVARREETDAFATLLACLDDGNRRWAKDAPVLVLAFAAQTHPTTGKPNAYARHDVGIASGLMAVQAASMGLQVHQMGGIEREVARERIAYPDDVDFVTAIAIGYPGAVERLPDDLQVREKAPRSRYEPAEIVFGTAWGEPAPVLELPG